MSHSKIYNFLKISCLLLLISAVFYVAFIPNITSIAGANDPENIVYTGLTKSSAYSRSGNWTGCADIQYNLYSNAPSLTYYGCRIF